MAVDTIDPYIVTALKLLHSSASDSAEKMRAMLDSEISKNHDKSKFTFFNIMCHVPIIYSTI